MIRSVTHSTWRLSFIRKLHDLVRREVDRQRTELDQLDPSGDEDDLVKLGDRYADLHDKLEGLGHKLIVVGLAATVENLLKKMIRQHGAARTLEVSKKDGWKKARSKIETLIGTPFDRLPEFSTVNRVRVLSNCFKHHDGFANDEYAEITGVAVGEKIDFGALPTVQYIDAVEKFLNALEDAPVAS